MILYAVLEVIYMTVKDAVAARFQQICKERRIKPNELANRAGVTPSSVYSMLDPKRREVSVTWKNIRKQKKK